MVGRLWLDLISDATIKTVLTKEEQDIDHCRSLDQTAFHKLLSVETGFSSEYFLKLHIRKFESEGNCDL